MPDFAEQRARMVERQLVRRGIVDDRLLAAFRAVPREAFVPDHLATYAYDDGPLPIGEGQTISQPYIVAAMIEAGAVSHDARVLEVGAGSGYAAAVLSRIATRVVAIERYAVLAEAARDRVDALGYANCAIVAGDGLAGWPAEAPFDAILVAARGSEVPDALRRQLTVGGRLVMPVGGEMVQMLRAIERVGEEEWRSRDIAEVRFVPLLPGMEAAR